MVNILSFLRMLLEKEYEDENIKYNEDIVNMSIIFRIVRIDSNGITRY